MPLPYKVKCKSTYAFFETIAAFDCDRAAINYAAECSATNPDWQYKVTKGKTLVFCAPDSETESYNRDLALRIRNGQVGSGMTCR